MSWAPFALFKLCSFRVPVLCWSLSSLELIIKDTAAVCHSFEGVCTYVCGADNHTRRRRELGAKEGLGGKD